MKAHKELGRDRTITDLLTEELQKSGGDEQALKLALPQVNHADVNVVPAYPEFVVDDVLHQVRLRELPEVQQRKNGTRNPFAFLSTAETWQIIL